MVDNILRKHLNRKAVSEMNSHLPKEHTLYKGRTYFDGASETVSSLLHCLGINISFKTLH